MSMTWHGTWKRVVIVGGGVLALAVASAEGCGGGSDTTAAPGTGATAAGGHGGSGAEGGTGGAQGGTGGAPACTGSETEPCYEGPDGTEGVGICHAGTHTCTQGQWGACEDEQIPLVEDCNAIGDEDCNGVPCSELLWSKMVGSQGIDQARAVAIDAAGNVAVAGEFGGTVDFGCGPLQNDGFYNGFLVLYAAGTGDCLWDVVVASSAISTVMALAPDADGNILLTGNFQQDLTVSGMTLTAGDTTDGFLLKVDASGGLLWGTNLATAAGATGSKTPTAVAVDAAGDVVLTGSYSGHWICPMPVCDVAPDMTALFVDKRSGADGHLVWRKNYDSPGHQGARAAVVEADGSIVVGGYFDQALDLGGPSFTAPTGRYGFLAKLAGDTGATVWARSFGDAPTATDQQQVSAIAIASGDDIVVTGQGAGGVAFDTGDVLSSAGDTDVFLARYTSTGDLVWRGLYGDAAAQLGGGVAVDSADNVILAGSNSGSVDFGGGALVSVGSADAFLAKFTGTRTLVWNKSFGGAGDDEGLGTAVDALGQIALVGYANASLDFGGGPLPYVAEDDAFVAMFYP
jgi:hypothetical protein